MRKRKSKPLYAREILSKIIPTDYRYHTLKLLSKNPLTKGELNKELAKISASSGTRKITKVVPEGFERGTVTPLEKTGMIKKEKGEWQITDFGKKVLNVTTNTFFEGKAPDEIRVALSRPRGKGVIRYGPLTSTFFGRQGTGIKKLLEMVNLHKLTGKKWLIYGGQRKAKGKGEILYHQEIGIIQAHTMPMSNLIRQHLIETELQVKWTNSGTARPRASLFRSKDIFVHNIQPVAKNIVSELSKLSEKDIKAISVLKTGTESVEDKKRITNFLEKRKVDPTVVSALNPREIQVIYWLSRGINNYPQVAKKIGTNRRNIFPVVRRLESKGLIEKHPMRLRVTLEDSKTQRIVNYLEALEDAVQEESKKNPKFKKKFFGV